MCGWYALGQRTGGTVEALKLVVAGQQHCCMRWQRGRRRVEVGKDCLAEGGGTDPHSRSPRLRPPLLLD